MARIVRAHIEPHSLRAWFVYAAFLYSGVALIDDLKTSFGVMCIAISYWVMTTYIYEGGKL